MEPTEDQNRIQELDGLRGIAILMVVIGHLVSFANPLADTVFLRTDMVRFVTLGWTGVDLFFVLSGFLITSILLKTRSQPHYFRNFYARRILRIFPIYYLGALAVYVFVLFFKPDINFAAIQAGLPFSLLYLQNWLSIPKFANHFAAAIPNLLGPTWSLAIEEQFYFIWPGLVYFLNRRKLFILSLAIVIFVFLTRAMLVYTSGRWPSLEEFIYFSTVTRFDGLCMGALVAIAFQSEKWKNLLARFAWPILIGSLIGLIGVAIANDHLYPLAKNPYKDVFGYSLLALGASALVVLVTTQPRENPVRFFFRNPVLTFFGKYSYAIYILHIPIIIALLGKMEELHYHGTIAWFVFVGMSFALTIAGALVSWHLLEKHALGLKRYFEYKVVQTVEDNANIKPVEMNTP